MKPKDVDEYIMGAPKEFQARLKEMRTAIKSAAPDAEELISYGMPYYSYKGRLIYFGYAKSQPKLGQTKLKRRVSLKFCQIKFSVVKCINFYAAQLSIIC